MIRETQKTKITKVFPTVMIKKKKKKKKRKPPKYQLNFYKSTDEDLHDKSSGTEPIFFGESIKQP